MKLRPGTSAAWLILLTAPPCMSADVKLPAEVEVQQDRITLGSLGAGLPAGLAAVPLGYAPYPGHHRWLSRVEVENAMQRAGYGIADLEVPERILVTRQSQRLEVEPIRAAVEESLQSAFPALEIELDRIELPQDIVLPAGDVEIQVEGSDRLRHFNGATLKLLFLVNGTSRLHQWTRIFARGRGPVVVAADDIPFGQVLRASDLAVEDRELEVLEAHFADIGAVAGFSTKKTLQSGSIVRADDVEAAVLVRRGDMVKLVVQTSGLRVSTAARATESGRLGEVIRVRNLDSRQVVEARVIEAGTVTVWIPGG